MQTLDKQWQDWIRDNFARGCVKEDMLKIMVKAGISEMTAAYNLVTFGATQTSAPARTASVAQTQAVAKVAQNDSNYQQEASYLFQHENTIVTSDGQQIQVAMRIDAPDVVLLDHFMTEAECDELCEASRGTLTKSTVVDDATGASVDHAERISQGTYFTIGQNALVKRIEQRISEVTNTPVVNGEGLQILNYVGGGEYRPHFDYFPDNEGGRVHLARGGQRIITVIMYLNNVTAGGATILPKINLSVYPKKGSALYFSYFNSVGQIDPITLHGGAPVIEGEKWIATKWIREREYK
jgi:prolyl 4-hydroxylase